MSRALKILGIIVLAIVLIVAGLAAYLVFGVDPERFKPRIERAASQQGVELQLKGDISWAFWPDLAIELGDVHFSSETHNLPPSSVESARLALDWSALLDRRVAVNALVIQGGDLHFRSVEQGAAAAAAPAAASDEGTAGGGDGTFNMDIQRIELRDSRVTLEGPDGETVIEALNVTSGGVNTAGEAFPLNLEFRYRGPLLETEPQITARQQLAIDLQTQQIGIREGELRVAGLLPQPLELDYEADVDLKQDRAELRNLTGRLAGLGLEGNAQIARLTEAPSASGHVELTDDNLRKSLKALLDTDIETRDKNVLGDFSLALDFRGSPDAVDISNLNLTLDDIRLQGQADMKLGTTRSLNGKLSGNRINLDPYLPPPGDTPPEPNQQAAMLLAPLAAPLAVLDGGRGNLSLSLEAVEVAGTTIEKPRLTLAAHGQQLALRDINAGVYDGTLAGTINVDMAPQVPHLSFRQNITELNLGKAMAQLAPEADIEGILTMTVNGQSRGADADALWDNLQGTGELRLEQFAINNINLERSYCELAARVENPPPREEPWPPGTRLNNLESDFRLDGRVIHLNNYTTGVGNLKVRGEGAVDLGEEAFALRVITRLEGERTSEDGCAVKSKRIRNRDVPLLCRDKFAEAGAGSCIPDPDFIKSLLRQEIIDRLGGDGEDGEEGSSTEQLLRGLLGD